MWLTECLDLCMNTHSVWFTSVVNHVVNLYTEHINGKQRGGTYRSVTLSPAGLAVRAAALEGGPQSREPDPVGEPVHDPPLPQSLPDGTRCHL